MSREQLQERTAQPGYEICAIICTTFSKAGFLTSSSPRVIFANHHVAGRNAVLDDLLKRQGNLTEHSTKSGLLL